MVRKKFGSKWWGKKWLDTLSEISDDARLKRGVTYANKDLVKDIKVTDEYITAKVQGRRVKPYTQTIAIKAFTKEEKETIFDVITNDAYYLSKLLNKELPSELNTTLLSHGISLFPKNWNEIVARCSCPDWALPCKHLAAVIYIVANEIDKNPFIIFQLHGMNILDELAQLGYSQDDLQISIPTIQNHWTKKKITSENLSLEQLQTQIRQIDFSLIPEENKQFQLLEDSPIFYDTGDFKAILNLAQNKAQRFATQELTTVHEGEITFSKNFEQLKIYIKDGYQFKGIEFIFEDTDIFFGKKKGILSLIEQLRLFNSSELMSYPNELIVIYYIYQFSLHLLKSKLYIPQLLKLRKDKYLIRWLPNFNNPSILNIFSILVKVLPANLFIIEDKSAKMNCDNKEAILLLVSLFIKHYLEQTETIKADNDFHFFISHNILNSNVYHLKETPYSIQKWLDKLYFSEKQHAIILKIDDSEDDDQFLLTIDVEIENEDKILDVLPLFQLLDGTEHMKHHISIMRDLAILSQYIPEIRSVLTSHGKLNEIEFDKMHFTDFLLETMPVIEMLGIKVMMPKALEKILRPKVTLEMDYDDKEEGVSYLHLEEMLRFNWKIAIGDRTISTKEFLQIVNQYEGLVKIKDQYVLLNNEEINAIKKRLEQEHHLSHTELLKIALAEEYEDAKIEINDKLKAALKSAFTQKSTPLPKNLEAQLRPYQKTGFEWMYHNTQIGFGCLLADDMGLGKTLQVITLLLKLKQEHRFEKGKALIVLPTTLLTNWSNEIKKFAPSLNYSIFHGTQRKPIFDHDITFTTYGIARTENKLLKKQKWEVLILDEAQNIKNTKSEQTKMIKTIPATLRIALSGTPVENRLSEYWSIFDFINKGYLNSLKHFSDNYIKAIEIDRNQKKLEAFKKMTSPFILRRLKTDKKVISDLPEKISTDQICTLTKEQSAIYQNIVNATLNQIATESGINRRGLIFKLMMHLKQICNHPSHYLKQDNIDINLSGKSKLLHVLLDNILANNEKLLIFTQFKEMGELLARMIEEQYNLHPQFLHGGVSRAKRDHMVDIFQNKPQSKIMLLSLKAGGTGLNLTAANHVIHYDLWWNPAVENQATDRAFRIGQKKNVMVYRFITQGTFEEKINKMLQKKTELADLTVDTGEKWIGEMSDNELKNIFSATF